jgi:hypothetical protein
MHGQQMPWNAILTDPKSTKLQIPHWILKQNFDESAKLFERHQNQPNFGMMLHSVNKY